MGIYNKKNQQKKTQRMKTPTPTTEAIEEGVVPAAHQEEKDEGSHAVAVSADATSTLTLATSTGAAVAAGAAPAIPAPRTMQMLSDGKYRNKRRCLVLCLRGATARYRHLLEDLRTLIPHHKKESKLDVSGGKAGAAAAINDIAAMNNCTSVLFLECRKQQDAYLWLGRVGSGTNAGPSVKFHLTNSHTMDELRLTGNCMKGSRPILSFDDAFTSGPPQLRILKCLFTDVFGTPRGHPKSKPFVDRVMAFYYADQKIWVRNYQILAQQPKNAREAAHLAQQMKQQKQDSTTSSTLVEIGPRFVLDPIRIFRGSFGGQTLYQNPNFISPNHVRAQEKKRKGASYNARKEAQHVRKERMDQLVSIQPDNPLDSVFR